MDWAGELDAFDQAGVETQDVAAFTRAILRVGADQPGVGREVFRLVGDLTALADGRLVLLTEAGEAHDLGDVLAALVGEQPDSLGDHHIGRVRPVLEVIDRHVGSGSGGASWPSRWPIKNAGHSSCCATKRTSASRSSTGRCVRDSSAAVWSKRS
jgi:hypothetical protein